MYDNSTFSSVVAYSPHVCTACGRRYRWASGLSRHKSFECGKAPSFPCPHCSYKAKQKGSILQHIIRKHYKQEGVPTGPTHYKQEGVPTGPTHYKQEGVPTGPTHYKQESVPTGPTVVGNPPHTNMFIF